MQFYVVIVGNRHEGRSWQEKLMVDSDDVEFVREEAKSFASSILRPVGTVQSISIHGPFGISRENRL